MTTIGSDAFIVSLFGDDYLDLRKYVLAPRAVGVECGVDGVVMLENGKHVDAAQGVNLWRIPRVCYNLDERAALLRVSHFTFFFLLKKGFGE